MHPKNVLNNKKKILSGFLKLTYRLLKQYKYLSHFSSLFINSEKNEYYPNI